MRYFNNALEDRRVFYIIDSGINPYAGSYTTPTKQPMNVSFGEPPLELIGGINTDTTDPFTTTSNVFNISPSNGDPAPTWGRLGAVPYNYDASPRYSDLSPAMRAHVDKFGETPTYVGSDGKVHVNREALIQRVVDSYAGPEGGSMNLDGFSVEGFMAADNDGRMAMLEEMRMQNDAAKAAKFEEDLRLAQERDAAKAAQNNAAGQAGGGWGPAIASLIQAFGSFV